MISIRFLLNGFTYLGLLNTIGEYHLYFNKFLIVIIPSFYLYFKNLITDEKGFFIKKDLIHFVFPLLFSGVNILIISNTKRDSVYHFYLFYSILVIYSLIYFFLAFQILNKNIWKKNAVLMNGNNDNRLLKNWTLFLFSMQVINTIRLFIAIHIEYSQKHIHIIGDHFQWLTAIVWCAIFFKILVSPEILYGLRVINTISKDEKFLNIELDTSWIREPSSNLNSIQDRKVKVKVDEKLDCYIDEIENFLSEVKLLKDSNFKLFDLAKKLKIPKSHLVYLFKYHSKISYSEFQNNIRIKYSMRLMESNYLDKHTLDTLAKEVGFTSYNPFLINFKKIVSISPQKYIEQLKPNKDII